MSLTMVYVGRFVSLFLKHISFPILILLQLLLHLYPFSCVLKHKAFTTSEVLLIHLCFEDAFIRAFVKLKSKENLYQLLYVDIDTWVFILKTEPFPGKSKTAFLIRSIVLQNIYFLVFHKSTSSGSEKRISTDSC